MINITHTHTHTKSQTKVHHILGLSHVSRSFFERVFHQMQGTAVHHAVVQDWKSNVQSVLNGYDLKDVFNCDETGLFWRGIPNRTMALKSDQCKGGKLAKKRLTVMLTVSALGEKLKPLVIGKAKMPRAFNKKYPHTIIWRSNSKA